jgi:hypothetical protein
VLTFHNWQLLIWSLKQFACHLLLNQQQPANNNKSYLWKQTQFLKKWLMEHEPLQEKKRYHHKKIQKKKNSQ